jgi:hypothetical protein
VSQEDGPQSVSLGVAELGVVRGRLTKDAACGERSTV